MTKICENFDSVCCTNNDMEESSELGRLEQKGPAQIIQIKACAGLPA